MSDAEAKATMVAHWMQKAEEAIAAAHREWGAGDFGLAVNRVYYACFYAARAVLLAEGHRFVKHTGVRSGLHKHLVKTGRVRAELAESYDRAFNDRMEIDYQIVAAPRADDVQRSIGEAEAFVADMKRFLGQ